MTNEMIFGHVDHTQLKPFAIWEDIQRLCEEAIRYKTASVCVPPCYIKRIKDVYKEHINVSTVVGFPLGYSTTEAKVEEVRKALEDGAGEIDMVINISDVKNGDYQKVEEEIKALKKAAGNHILKVIIETCYLTQDEIIAMCHAVTQAKADYIKTSTGFGTEGATRENIKLLKEYIGPGVKIKAAGGIRTKDDLESFIAMGCDRLGTSSAVDILIKSRKTDNY